MIITVVNLFLLNSDSEDVIPVGVGGETYLTGGKGRLQTEIDRVDHKDYMLNLVGEVKKSKQKELVEQLRIAIEKENKDKFLITLRNDIRHKYTEKMKEDLKKEISDQYTRKYFKDMKLSYGLFEQLRAEYYHDFYSNIKQFDFMKLFRETNLPEVKLPKDFPDRFDATLDRLLNKQEYLSNIVNEFLIENKPLADEMSDNEKGRPLEPRLINVVPEKPLSKKELTDGHANLPSEKYNALKKSHDAMVRSIKNLEEPPYELVKGQGIVIYGGGDRIGSALVNIFQLRDQGSDLPIELILDKEEEYDEQVCDELLAIKFKTKCIVMESAFGKELYETMDLKDSQKRAFSLLVSSFNHIISIDADNLAIKNVDNLIASEPYLSSSFVLWPQAYQRQTSPLFYEIAQVEQGEVLRRNGLKNDISFSDYIQKNPDEEITFHDFSGLPSAVGADSSQFVFSKRRHFKSFLLALYYNYYGPQFYYPLIYQGAPDMDDRDTWAAALTVMNEPYYIAEQKIGYIGTQTDLKDKPVYFQNDVRDNVDFLKSWKAFIKKENVDTRLNPNQENEYTTSLIQKFHNYHQKLIPEDHVDQEGNIETVHRQESFQLPKPMFVHVKSPKINPFENFKDENAYVNRLFGASTSNYRDLGLVDWELRFHTISKWYACYSITSEKFWQRLNLNQKEVCEKVTGFTELLKKDSKDSDATVLSYIKKIHQILKDIDTENRMQQLADNQKEYEFNKNKNKLAQQGLIDENGKLILENREGHPPLPEDKEEEKPEGTKEETKEGTKEEGTKEDTKVDTKEDTKEEQKNGDAQPANNDVGVPLPDEIKAKFQQ